MSFQQPNPHKLWVALLASATLLTSTSITSPTAQAQTPAPTAAPTATTPTGCRIVRTQAGVYSEPNTSKEAVATLKVDTIVTLGTGTGNGWARITLPSIGWIQAVNLKGNNDTLCTKPTTPAPAPTKPAPAPTPKPAPTPAPKPAPKPTGPIVGSATCDVTATPGLVIRDKPNFTDSKVIGSLATGRYSFQFTDKRVSLQTDRGMREWVYITGPSTGWISTGFTDGAGSNLSGQGCR